MAALSRVQTRRQWRIAMLVAAILGTAAVPARGQSTGAIEGLVRDQSGGVLPGVTVEISSPALIEGARVATTESTGNYRFLRLPVGEYTIKFSLTGFRPVVRENVIVNAEFTATINADLAVGALEETLTVTGESPLVDVRTTTGQTIVTSEVVNTIPSSRNIFEMAKFVLGMSQPTPDVGSSTSYTHNPLKIHGSKATDRSFYLDGAPSNGWFGGGDTPIHFDGSGGMAAEIDFQTTALPAWMPTGGVAVSVVAKSGGNRFSGELFGNGQVAQSANLDDELRGRGVRATSGSESAYDVDASLGGPIKRDRMWFFGAVRHKEYDGLLANSFLLDGSQASESVTRGDYYGKASTKLNPANTLALVLTSDTSVRPNRRGGATFVSLEAATYNKYTPNYFFAPTWTGSRGNAWIFEIQATRWIYGAPLEYRPEVGPNDVPRLDIVTSVLTGAPVDVRKNDAAGSSFSGSVTRVGNWFGNHELRAGVQTRGGFYKNTWIWHGDIILRFRNGAPDSVDLANTPTNNDARVSLAGLFLQDAWRAGQRLTINAGVRYDQFHGWMPEQSSPAGTWIGERHYPEVDVQTWRNVVPRLGVAYDLFGNARTVVKGSASVYMGNEGIGIVDSQNPAQLSMNRCAWTDSNGDLYAQASEISRCAGWSGGVNTRIDPDLRRPFNREYSVGVEHQLTRTFAATVMFFRREYRDQRATANLAVPLETYIPVVISNPLNNQPLTIYNQNPLTTGLQDNIVVNASKLDTTYNGIELAVQRRFSANAYLRAGYHYGKDLGRIAAGELNDPNADIFADGAVGTDEPHQLKVSGALLLPARISVSAFFQARSGQPKVRQLQVGRALVPTLTRATQTVRLERNDENRYDSVALLDLRVGRPFRFGSWRTEIFADAYNLLNANTVLTEVTTVGPNLGQVSQTIPPRVVRVGAKLAF